MTDSPISDNPIFPLPRWLKLGSISSLLFSAVLAAAFIIAGGFTVYSNMRNTEEVRAWVSHSQGIVTNLQVQEQRLDRVDYGLQLYSLTGVRAHLKMASSNLSTLSISLVQLRDQMKDNDSQERHVQELDRAVADLVNALNQPDVGSDSRTDPQNRPVPERQISVCRDKLSILLQEERALLRQRSDGSRNSFYRSFLLTIGYLGVSTVIVALLFGFLFRDSWRRRHDERRLFAANNELEATVLKLTERVHESALLTSARDELQLCTSAQQAYDCAAHHMQRLLPDTNGAILMISNSRRMVEIVSEWGHPTALLDGVDLNACCGLRAGKLRWRKPGLSELDCAHFLGAPPDTYLCVPLAAYGETMGFAFISFEKPEAVPLAEARSPLVMELAELGSLSIAGLNLRARLERQSIRDGLTGLFNRHFMEIALEREIRRVKRQKTTLAVLMLDVDHYKQFNDTFGHEAGDIVLRQVAECFRRAVREEDVICRYGGEEFIIIMPDVTEQIARLRAESILTSVAETQMQFRGEVLRSVTVSAGIAMYPVAGKRGEELIRMADAALYRAKHNGRNQVQSASTKLEPETATTPQPA
ncbi:GGDEF domain-containing protein [Granulicella sp. WH15]|uniref:sensor domain-containing diguanylate cyclase n=1 Tax=Granulicella sp. WH15 TaxID=2602070 RepID=UPI0013672ABB|nr:sensor domain-containing diguanylate cyclase [Granulicella sp. WH15]QHN02080.1 GGDEF domain-containing protein [Granulicella sp. WH15]